MIEKNQHFPTALQAAGIVVAMMLLEFGLWRLIEGMLGTLGLNRLDGGGMVTLIANAIIFTALMEYKGMTYRELFHSVTGPSLAEHWQVLLAAILLTVPALVGGIMIIVQMLESAFPLSSAQEEMFMEMGSGTFGAIVLACLMAPVLEEMLFRGVILRSFLGQYPRWYAITGSALIFGVAHMNLYQFAVGLGLGMFLGWLYERTRSLLPCIALHVAYNSACTLMMHRGAAVPGAGDSTLELMSMAAIIVMFGAWGMHLLRAMLEPAKK